MGRPPTTSLKVLEVKAEHPDWGAYKIGNYLGKHKGSVRVILRNAGWPRIDTPPLPRAKKWPLHIIRGYAESGYTATPLGVILGVTRQRASQLLHEAGVLPLKHPPLSYKGEVARRDGR